MSRSIDVEKRLAILRSAAAGILDGLPCPDCGRDSVSVRFTNPSGDEFRTWFLCSACDFRMRAQNSGRPPHFTESRIDPDLEERDRQ
ncbi:MAG: hypothetical protein HUU26_01000 [Gemmatimonadaceae bacterium]|nr:hypothetical protein [Planctomycetota bacterium]NUQ10892.1 hypothetical protein [Gemmatimonadaceae bacterium]